MENIKKILETFIELCDEAIYQSYVITDGKELFASVLDYEIAVKLCEVAKNKTGRDGWVIVKFKDAISYAYKAGRFDEFHKRDINTETQKTEEPYEENQ